MNAHTGKENLRVVLPAESAGGKPTGLALLREPFPPHQISKLPKPTKRQTEEVRNDFKKGIRCKVCGLWHHPDVVHLDYVGHAALTDRLLDCDPNWNWEPMRVDEFGAPLFDEFGGMWIKLTVCGQTRMGYGDPDGKRGGNAIKECIGDALRNAAMRFGAALDLWHKGDLHLEEETPEPEPVKTISPDQYIKLRDKVEEAQADEAAFLKAYHAQSLQQFPLNSFADAMVKLQRKIQEHKRPDDLAGDGIPEFEGQTS